MSKEANNDEEDCYEKKSIYENFDEIAEKFSDQNACIVTQPAPDPDAIGSSIGLQWLLEVEYGIICDVYHSGSLSHPQNQTMANILDIDLKTKEEFESEKYDLFIVVDTVPQNTGFTDIIDHFHMIIDHHQFDIESDLVDIRSVGSCSTIIWDYLRQYDDIDFNTEKGAEVATALLFGIRNDTDFLLTENTNSLDYEAHRSLIPLIDKNTMKSIVNYSQPSHMLDLKKKAIENKIKHDSIMISGLGIIPSKERDALPIIADELIHTEGVETVIVFSIINDFVEASIRSNNSSINVHDLCQSIFGEDYAGGKMRAGGAKVPIGFLYSSEDDIELRDEIWETAQKILKDRILRFFSGEV